MNEIDNLNFQFYKKNNEYQIRSLFKKTFKKKLSLNFWTWVFKKNTNGKNKILLVFNKKKLIGQCAAVKLSFKLYKKKKAFYRIQNFMVDINFRGKKIATNALKKLTSSIIKKKDYIITFPNNNSLKAFLKNDYTKFNLYTYEKIIKRNYKIKENIFFKNSSQIKFFKEDIDLINETLHDFSIFNLRDEKYLSWRYSVNYNNYKISRIFQNKKLLGIAVLKFYPEDKSICICELFYKKGIKNLMSILNTSIHNLVNYNPEKIKIWSMPHFWFHKNLLKLGFKKTNFKTNVCIYKNLIFNNTKKNFFLSMGDSDVY